MTKISKSIIIYLLYFTLFNGSVLYSQNNIDKFPCNSKEYIQAIELYKNQMYSASYYKLIDIEHFIQQNNIKNCNIVNIKGYKLLCKIKLKHSNIAGEIKEYEENFGYSPLINNIWFNYAIENFNDKDYIKAEEYFNKIDIKSIPQKNIPELLFKQGYCFMDSGKFNSAKAKFNKILSGKYYHPAQYYLGHINYIKKDFKAAIPFFEKSKEDIRFKELSKIHLLECNFMIKDYNYVIKHGEDLYKSISNRYQQRVIRILSESYYAINDIDKANYYYELYTLNTQNISRSDFYYSGMIAYNLKNYQAAINSFNNVISTNDSLSQSAYYHLGQCYLSLKNKHKAQEAFFKAAEDNFDNQIKEDAFFNYAKLSFDITRNIEPFAKYLSDFLVSDAKWDEIHNYMATAFINKKNYANAIFVLEQIKNPDILTYTNLQKANFLRGFELVQSEAYNDAINFFDIALTLNTNNTNLKNIIKYWLAECKYRVGNNADALKILNSLENTPSFKNSNEYSSINYNKGYNNFMLGDYKEAINNFSKYLNSSFTNKEYSNEAELRLADSYFMNKEYSKASNLFEKIALKNNYANLYAPIQAAISYGLISNDNKKIELLEKITTSKNKKQPYYTKALYELSRTYIQNVRDNEAEVLLNKLINNPPDSIYYYKALLDLGMIKANAKQNKDALFYYEQIVKDNPISNEGQSALSGIENIYLSENKAEEFLEYLDGIGLSNIKTATKKETLLFNSAEQQFLNGNYNVALNSLNSFIQKYPNGANTNQALFYVAECFNKLGKKEKAAETYYSVMMNDQEGAFRENATLNYGRLCFQLQRYTEAIKAYETLGKIAQLENNILESNIGKMESYYMAEDYPSAIKNCDNILNNSKIDKDLKRRVTYIKSKSLQSNGEREKALKLFKELSENKIDTYGAEASYLLILDAYDAGDFEKVENLTFNFSDSKTPQSYWLAMSFIILGDSYAERDNFEQAEATFKSIYNNYSGINKEEILDQIKMRLDKLKKLNNNNL